MTTSDSSRPMRIIRIAATITVTDIEKALGFYRDQLGLEVVFRNGDPTGFVILKRDGAEVHLSLDRTHRATDHNVAHLLVENVDVLYGRMRQSGARIVKDIRNKAFGLRAFVVEDIDGNRLDIGEAFEGESEPE
jgi:catechol 2,3-dioxygenase-like lactoylglutathione lyase family enzyme